MHHYPILRFLLTGLFFGLSTAYGQSDSARKLATVPFFTLTGGVVIVQAQINDRQDTLNFILDTGSGGISLDSATCVQLKIQPVPSDKIIKGIGGVRQVRYVHNVTLRLLNGVEADSLSFHVNDYEILSSVYGVRIDGIIGYSFLSRYIVELDYDQSLMHIFSQGRFTYPKGGFLLKPYLGVIPIVYTRFSDDHRMKGRFYFDSGAGLCFLLSKAYAEDSMVMRRRKPPVVRTQAEGVGGRTEMSLTTVRSVRIGPYTFRDVPTYVFDDPYNILSYPNLAGLIGNDILRRFNTVLNYRKREFYLVPNRHMREVFDYSYTGLGLYFINGKVMVEDVISGSPGEKAGFREGDIIFGIDRNFSGDIQQYKNLLQATGQKIKVFVSRPEGLMELRLKPRNIMKRR